MFRKLLTVRYRAYAIDHQIETSGYVDKENYRIQYFIKEILLFGFIKIYHKTLFKEHVPNWAWIQWATCVWCEWRSDCPPDIWLLCTGKVKA